MFDEAARTAFETYPKTKEGPPTVRFEQVSARAITRISDGLEEAMAAKEHELPALSAATATS